MHSTFNVEQLKESGESLNPNLGLMGMPNAKYHLKEKALAEDIGAINTHLMSHSIKEDEEEQESCYSFVKKNDLDLI